MRPRICPRRRSTGPVRWWVDQVPRDTWRDWGEMAALAVLLPLLLAEVMVLAVGLGAR